MIISCSAVLFDLDGVLVDSTGYVERQWREWAAGRGVDPEPFLRVCHGRRAVETIQLAAPDLDAEAEVARFPEFVVEDGVRLDPLPGARQLLEGLPGGLWAVVTSGVRASASKRIREAGLPVPRVLVAAEDVAHGKPNPEGYLLAAERLDVAPAGCLVIEDAPAGLEAARAAGMRTIGFASTHARDELSGANVVIARLPVVMSRPIDEGIELLVPELGD
ncbi:MAG TPA: HAD-IA family hydrolase [Gemmatimonadales bacterium]|jgi:sugar-phosphatase|nr:HAD-IA family hydrolase [Gemmatimonadales bacterium]